MKYKLNFLEIIKNYASFFRSLSLFVFSVIQIIILKHQTFEIGIPVEALSIQLFILIIGKFSCLFAFGLRISLFQKKSRRHFRKYKNEALKYGARIEINYYFLIVSAMLNISETILLLYGFFYWPLSMTVMVYQFNAFLKPILKRLFFGSKFYFHRILGLIFVFMCIVLIVLSIFALEVFKIVDEGFETPFFALIIAVLIKSVRLIYEKSIRRKFKNSQFRINGLEGLISIIIFSMIQFILYLLNMTDLTIVSQMLGVIDKKNIVVSMGLLLLVSCSKEYSISRCIKKRYKINHEINFFVVSVLVFVDLWVNYFSLEGKNVLYFNLLTFVRYLFYFLMLIGNFIVNEKIEIRKFQFSSDLKKYETKFSSNENQKIQEEFSIMN